MTAHPPLSPRHQRVMVALLREHPTSIAVGAYAGRVNGLAHDSYDLDPDLRGPGLEGIPTEWLMDFEDDVR